MKNCPKCDSDHVRTDSNNSVRISFAECRDCDFKIQKSVPEERIIELWDECKNKVNKILKKYAR